MARRVAVFAVLMVLAGCGSDINNKDAVRQGVIDHLSSRKGLDLDLSAMDVEVSSVTFRGNEADADIAFRARGSQQSMMQMKYTLERDGSRWKVKAKKDSGGGHAMPASPPPGDMPAGHPPIEPGAKK
ncbi:MAG: hypothetical protein R2729_15285 [Bryobacteraceae bacterium]